MSVKKPQKLHVCLLISRVIFLLLLSAWFCLPIYAQQPKESANSNAIADKNAIKVPFELYGNHILVPVRVNNSPPFWFYFDSGAGVNLINKRTAEKLGLKSRGSVTIAANGGTGSGSLIENAAIEKLFEKSFLEKLSTTKTHGITLNGKNFVLIKQVNQCF